MPIYEYQSVSVEKGCGRCQEVFEIYQGISEDPLVKCPSCHGALRKLVSRCHSAIVKVSEGIQFPERQISEYEQIGMWSHAAELADKHSEQTGDKNLKMRALHDYRKAGYDVDKMNIYE